MLSNTHKPLDRLTLFSYFWAYQGLVQHLRHNGIRLWFYGNDIFGWIELACIFAVLFNPRSIRILLAYLAASIVEISIHMPVTSVHITFEYLLNLTLFSGILLARLELKNNREDREAVYDYLAPFIRAMLIVFYFIVVFHKLNYDFFDRTVSCVSFFYQKAIDRIPFNQPSGPRAMNLAIAGTMAFEILIPIFLCFKRTRKLAIFSGIIFHLILAVPSKVGIKGFTTMLFALYLLFTSRDFAARVGEWTKNLKGKGRWLGIIFAGLFTASTLLTVDPQERSLYEFLFEFIFWWPSTAIVVWLYVTRLPKAGNDTESPTTPGKFRKLLWVFTLIVIFLGLNPFIGLRTNAAMGMFSNQRTEGGLNNHFFMPSLKIWKFQDDLVEVTQFVKGSKDVTYQYEGLLMPYFQLQADMHKIKEDSFTVTFIRNGETITQSRVNGVLTNKQVASDLPPWWQRKLLIFRKLDKGNKQHCRH